MLYFDIRPCLKRLSNEEKGMILEAILDYSEHGVLPEVEGMVGVAWDFIQPRLDRDRERYETISEKRTAAINTRWERERGIQKNTNEYNPIQTIPTTTTPTTPTPTPTTTPTTTTTDGAPSAFLFPSPSPLEERTVDEFEALRRQSRQAVENYNP